MLKCNQKITPQSGLEWLLENDPEMRNSGIPIRNLGGLAFRIFEFEDRSCGSVRLDMEVGEDGGGLDIFAAHQQEEEIESWRFAEFAQEFEALLDLVREEGTAGLAVRLRCSQRSVQQKLKKMFELGVEDLFTGEVA